MPGNKYYSLIGRNNHIQKRLLYSTSRNFILFKKTPEIKLGFSKCWTQMVHFGWCFRDTFSLHITELCLDSEVWYFWYKLKKWFLWTMVAAQAAKNHGDEWDLTWYFQRGIYTSIPTWTHSQNSLEVAETEFKDILPRKWSRNDHKHCPNQHENSHKQCNERGHPVVNMMESQWKLIQQHDNISQWKESLSRTNTSVRRNI